MNALRPRIRPLTQGVLHARQLPRLTSTTALQTRLYATADRMPRIAQSSFWNLVIPKFVRNRLSRDPQVRAAARSQGWNPATFYIMIFILIGSQAIRMLTLKNDFGNYTRSTDARIALLKDVIEKVQRGEEVDVEKILGTGDEAREREWDEAMGLGLGRLSRLLTVYSTSRA